MALAVLALAGCSATTPFITSSPPAERGEHDAGPRVSVCYNSFKTSPEKLQEMAQSACFGHSVARLIHTDYWLEACPALTPGRATFVCEPAK